MRNTTLCLLTIEFVVCLLSNVFADNPIVQTLYTADPAPMVYNDRVYLYTSHDEDVLLDNFFTMKNWKCYSSSDMVNWTDHGMAASIEDFKWGGTNGAWAPQCIRRNGKFYLYCPIHMKGIGVLVSDSPYGPFADPLGKPLINKSSADIDPTVFIDDDGQAYLYWGNPDLYYVKLNENMTSYSGSIVKVALTVESFGKRSDNDRPTSYEEGPWFYKKNNLYYMVFAGGPISEHIGYSISSSPTGPWAYKGVIMPTQGGSFTNHPGIIDYKGNSYLFYHNAALPGGGGFNRSVCVEQFTYKADGTIPTINMTKGGPVQIGNLDPYDTVQAETICWEQGIETEKCSEGGISVGNIEDGDYIKVKGVNFGPGAVSFTVRVASANSGGNIELRLDSLTGTIVGACKISGTGGWQNWVTDSCITSGATEIHDLFLKFTGGSGFLFNINWWKFNQPETESKPSIRTSDIFRQKINVLYTMGKTRIIKLNFLQPITQEKLNVCLFGLDGRKKATLFSGHVSTKSLTLPFHQVELRRGTYILMLSLNKEKYLTTTIVVH